MFKLTVRLLMGNRINLLNALICFATLPFLLTLVQMAQSGWQYHAAQQAGFLPDQVIFLDEPVEDGVLERLFEDAARQMVTGGHILVDNARFQRSGAQSPPQALCLIGRRFNAAPTFQLQQSAHTLEVTLAGYQGGDYLQVAADPALQDGPCRLMAPEGSLLMEAVDFGRHRRLYLGDPEDQTAVDLYHRIVTRMMRTFADPHRSGIGWDRFAAGDNTEPASFEVTMARFCAAYAGMVFPAMDGRPQVLASERLHRIIGDGRNIQEMDLILPGGELAVRVLDRFSLAPEQAFPENLLLFAYCDFDRLFQFGGKSSYAFLYHPNQSVDATRNLLRRAGLRGRVLDRAGIIPQFHQQGKTVTAALWFLFGLFVAIAVLNLAARLIQFVQRERASLRLLALYGARIRVFSLTLLLALLAALPPAAVAVIQLRLHADQLLAHFYFPPLPFSPWTWVVAGGVCLGLLALMYVLETRLLANLQNPSQGVAS